MKQLRNGKLFLITFGLVGMLITSSMDLYSAYAAEKPKFNLNTSTGVYCNQLWDQIEDHRKKGEKEQADAKANHYGEVCAPIYGGSPRLNVDASNTIDLGQLADPSVGSTKEGNKTESANIQKVIPFSNMVTNNNSLNSENTQTNTNTLKNRIESAQAQRFIPFLNDQQGDGSNGDKNSATSPAYDASNYPKTVTVHFDSITVKHDHDLVGGGEWRVSAYVQGNRIDLTRASGTFNQGLDSVDDGKTIEFGPGDEIKVEMYGNYPLSIFTVGGELDSCAGGSYTNRSPLPDKIPIQQTFDAKAYSSPLSNSEATALKKDISLVAYGLYINSVAQNLCTTHLGEINDIYNHPYYGFGKHTVGSTSGDFILIYTISVTGGADSDNDGRANDIDNCPSTANQDQKDVDRDGKGNVCDPDDDNDGVADSKDNCKVTRNPDQADFDDDGKGDRCDLDSDGDDVVDRKQREPPLAADNSIQ